MPHCNITHIITALFSLKENKGGMKGVSGYIFKLKLSVTMHL